MPVARAGGRTPGATLRATSITPLGYTGELKSLVNTGYLSADDVAVYALWLFPGQTLDIRLSTAKDFLLTLLDENGDPLAVSDRVVSGTESITYGYNDYGYGPQVMMIGVGAYQAGSYTLRVSTTDPPVDSRLRRIAGADRYLTAVAASQDAFPEGADTVVIATGANFPDALSAAGLCGV
ncbi:MAG: cell wall-binding repeat-containing protein [Anaerosomatales bacterium]|nr:cell wall-binding repeat-containing protein [Anaerosomatales bacterium]